MRWLKALCSLTHLNASVVEPWQRVVTSKLSGGSEVFVPHRSSLAFSDLTQRLTMIKVRGTSSTITGSVDSSDQGKGGRPATGGDKPFGDVAAVFGKTLSVSGTVSQHETKLQFISVSSSVDLDNISSGGDTSLFGDLFPIFISKK